MNAEHRCENLTFHFTLTPSSVCEYELLDSIVVSISHKHVSIYVETSRIRTIQLIICPALSTATCRIKHRKGLTKRIPFLVYLSARHEMQTVEAMRKVSTFRLSFLTFHEVIRTDK